MKLYNTPTKTIEDIEQAGETLSVYTCGPTVYDYPHIGNWFTFLRYDTLVRALKAQDYKVKWVMNITDVGHLVSDADEGEDKLEKGAKREGKTAWEVAQFYGDYFIEGLKRLNISMPDLLPKATDHIAEQIALVERLEQGEHTYVIDDGVYFDTSTFPSYANFAGLDLADQEAGARVEFNPQKRNASDFALWKFSPKGEQRDMEWDSPWGKGFPGWHLECSAMAMKYLGETLDIHAGGVDHIPVHHTNEIAQSEAATGKLFARYWLHANHISVNGEKISKSLGNGITLEEIEAKNYSLVALRLYSLESHYRTQSKFTWEGLEAASKRLNALYAMATLRWQTQESAPRANFSLVIEKAKESLFDDLATPSVLSQLSELEATLSDNLLHPDDVDGFTDLLGFIDGVFGLDLISQSDISDDQKYTLSKRQEARDNKDWQQSDALRDELQKAGLGVRDTPSGQIWHRL
jgi:cysteinyl-tRNA synthetase